MKQRYLKNIDEIFTEELQTTLLTKTIAVIGCGGQGGYILEYLARLGVKKIVFWDGDIYNESNLNRQIGCTEKTIGQNKVQVLNSRIKEINSSIILEPKNWFFGDQDNDLKELMSVDFVFMAADCNYNIYHLGNLLRTVILSGIPVIDCPVHFLGGSVTIDTKNDLSHFDFNLQNRIQQYQNNFNIPNCCQSAYKCALIAAEAVNQMVLYFNNSHYACVDMELGIDIYHHKYILKDKYGQF